MTVCELRLPEFPRLESCQRHIAASTAVVLLYTNSIRPVHWRFARSTLSRTSAALMTHGQLCWGLPDPAIVIPRAVESNQMREALERCSTVS